MEYPGEAYGEERDMRSEIKVHDRLRVLYADATDEFFRNVVQKSGHN